ncbi:MAG TPA: VWA domain-containing protein [Pyrinomonadaceae bacterium]|nr:VWA domain-containing protein [Pyrinomonadaceae bacterium]
MKLSFRPATFLLAAAAAVAAVVLMPEATPQQISSHSVAAQTRQQTPPPRTDATPQQDENVEGVTIRLVRVPITVVDKKGAPITGLGKNDFQIFEDKRPQVFDLISVTEELERLPIYVGVLMDTSSSTAGKLKFEQEAALNFIHTVARPRKDKIAFVTFDDEVTLRQDFTDRLELLDRAIGSIKSPGNHTSLYDAVWQFCNEKLRSVGGGRPTIVLITDGDDTYSRARLEDAIDIAQRTDTVVFAISTKGGFVGSAVPGVEANTVKDAGDRALVKLAEETGGQAFFTGDILALERAFNKIARALRSQYIATYRPSNPTYDGSTRRIEVKLTNKIDGAKVTAKRAYRAISDTVK